MSLYIYPNWKICTVCNRLYPPKIIFRLNKLGVDAFRVDPDKMVKGLLPQVRLDVYFPGFPTLKHIPHKVKLSFKGNNFHIWKHILSCTILQKTILYVHARQVFQLLNNYFFL